MRNCGYRLAGLAVFLVTTALLGGHAHLYAQPAQGPGGPRDKDPRKMIESMRIWRLSEELNLSEDQLAKVLPKMKAMEETRREYRRRRQGILREIDEILNSGKPSDKEIEDRLAALQRAEEDFNAGNERIRRELAGVLTPEQQGRLVVFEDKFEGEIRGLLSEYRERNRRLLPSGPGPGDNP